MKLVVGIALLLLAGCGDPAEKPKPRSLYRFEISQGARRDTVEAESIYESWGTTNLYVGMRIVATVGGTHSVRRLP